jgi:hypothetical protein
MDLTNSTAETNNLLITQYPNLVFTGELSNPTGPGSHLTSYESVDNSDQILTFFRQKLKEQFGDAAIVGDMPLGDGEAQLIATDGSSKMYVILVTPEGTGTSVGITTMTETSQ